MGAIDANFFSLAPSPMWDLEFNRLGIGRDEDFLGERVAFHKRTSAQYTAVVCKKHQMSCFLRKRSRVLKIDQSLPGRACTKASINLAPKNTFHGLSFGCERIW